jgi:bifunctional enzyme CysN/CysC
VILLDARQGVVEQTRRHAYIASILEIPHVVFAVNKMDLVGFSQERFDEIVTELEALNAALGTHDPKAIPMSALRGDNVVEGCAESMPWWDAPPLLEFLEQIQIATDRNLEDRRFPVQWVIRPMSEEHHDYRGYAGRVASGIWQAGDEVVVLPSGLRTRVASVENADGPLDAAVPPMSITMRLADDVDVSRGNMLADPARPPIVAREVEARVCWMSERPLAASAKLGIKHTTRTVRGLVEELVSVVDIRTLDDVASPATLELNDIGIVRLRLSEPLCVDPYAGNRETGAFILIDEATNDTVGAGMIVATTP